MDLIAYADVLDFDIEHPLTREPLRIDLVIIKKKKNVVIEKNIAAIFRGWNIVEYKSPEDSLTIADFHQVMAYAHLYCTAPEKGDMGDLTITFVTSREPRDLKGYLREVYGYSLTERWPGITVVTGDVPGIQILERKKLAVGEAFWLASLGGDLSMEGTRAVLEEAQRVPKGSPLGAYLYMLVAANKVKVREVLKMADMATIDKVFEGLGIIERYEARGETRGEKEKALEIAGNLKKIGLPLEQIAASTGLTVEQIKNL
jgi:hypothetical protein